MEQTVPSLARSRTSDTRQTKYRPNYSKRHTVRTGYFIYAPHRPRITADLRFYLSESGHALPCLTLFVTNLTREMQPHLAFADERSAASNVHTTCAHVWYSGKVHLRSIHDGVYLRWAVAVSINSLFSSSGQEQHPVHNNDQVQQSFSVIETVNRKSNTTSSRTICRLEAKSSLASYHQQKSGQRVNFTAYGEESM